MSHAGESDFRRMHGEPVGAVPDFIAYHGRFSANRTACVDLKSQKKLTYAEFDQRIERCAGLLEVTLGDAFGVRIALLSRNTIDLLVLYFACIRRGAIFQPLNWRLSGHELKVLIADAGPDLLIYQSEFEDAAKEAMKGHDIHHVLTITPESDAFGDAITAASPVAPREVPADTPILLLYTSGTTGRPKGVIITKRNAWSTSMNFSFIGEIAARDVVLCDVPLFHVAGLCGLAAASLLKGATLLLSDRFVPGKALALMSDPAYAITHYFAVPQMAQVLHNDPDYAKSDLTRLKAIISGGAPVPPSLVEAYSKDGVMLVAGYGLSEAGTAFGVPADKDVIAAKPNSSGVPALMIEARIVGPDGKDVPEGGVGEVWLRGPSVSPGYWRQPEATAKVFSEDGWYKTGDAGRRDADGFYEIVDRWKDMYISGGENVYPAEVEDALLRLDGVAEAGVVGVPDARWGEVGCAFVVLHKGSKVTEADVIAYARERLARYKVPKSVRFVDALPRTASGKIQKQVLRQQAEQAKS
jgi:fatty-acyl-CoA synthase